MPSKKVAAGFATAAALVAGGAATDAAINPYDVKSDSYEIRAESTLEAAGENRIELAKGVPEITLGKWNDEVALKVRPAGAYGEGSRQLFTDRIEWKNDTQEVHAYPLEATEEMEDGGFEIEIYLTEPPETNVFDFHIDNADNLIFGYQSPEYCTSEGIECPENVIGSYAVYHKNNANHRLGDTNYATGKAFHIYRPKAIDANGIEEWCELAHDSGTLSVTCSQKWLENAAYPVTVDPTFGYTSCGSTSQNLENNGLFGRFTISEDGTGDSISVCTTSSTAAKDVIMNIYDDGSGEADTSVNTITNGITAQVETPADFSLAFRTAAFVSPPTLVSGTVYRPAALGESGSGAMTSRIDALAGHDEYVDGMTFPTFANPSAITVNNNDNRLSIYVTYTAAGGGDPAPEDDTIFEITHLIPPLPRPQHFSALQ